MFNVNVVTSNHYGFSLAKIYRTALTPDFKYFGWCPFFEVQTFWDQSGRLTVSPSSYIDETTGDIKLTGCASELMLEECDVDDFLSHLF